MKDQVLSIEQMKHLKEMGVDISRASMSILLAGDGGYVDIHNTQVRNNGEELEWWDDENECWVKEEASYLPYDSVNPKDRFGVFTLQDLLEMMPKIIYEKSTQRYANLNLEFTKDKVGICYLVGSYIMFKDYRATGKTIIEAAYNMICWLAENKLLGKEGRNE